MASQLRIAVHIKVAPRTACVIGLIAQALPRRHFDEQFMPETHYQIPVSTPRNDRGRDISRSTRAVIIEWEW